MKRSLLKYALPVMASVLLISCKSEIDLFGDVEEVPVVFALLDQSDSVQYFRINPTFVGQNDARELASDPSLTNYAEGELDVILLDLDLLGSDGKPVGYMVGETRDIPLNNDGIFGQENLLYRLATPVTTDNDGKVVNSILVANHRFSLYIKHNPTGEVYTSEISIGDVNDLRMITPLDGNRDRSNSHLKFYTGEQYRRFTFQFGTMAGASRYKLEMIFYYTEGGATFPDSSLNFVTYDIGEISGFDPNVASLSIDFDGEKFYSVIQNVLSEGPDRHGRKVDFVITAAGEDLNTYIEVQNASLSGLSQERPNYTNISNQGLGVFSFRSSKLTQGFYLNDPTAKWLVNVADNPYNAGSLFRCVDFGSSAGERSYCRP